MRPLTAVLICTLAVLFYAACASPEPANSNSASSTTANANTNSATAPTMTNPSPSSSPTPAAGAQPGPTVVTAKPAASPAAGAKEEKSAASSVNAAELFGAQKCTGCHGADGKGKLKGAPDFSDAAWQKKQTDTEMVEAIKKGHKPMPAYEDKFSTEQINALVSYVRAFAKK